MKLKINIVNIVGNNKVYLGLGSNLGDRPENIGRALDEISYIGDVIRKSDIYETEPVGYKDQGDFLNLVLELETALSPFELLAELQKIETGLGRDRDKEKRFGPRVIDIDILFFNDEIVDTENLKIPHPRAHERNFVLTPLLQITPELIHPILKQNIKTLHSLLKNSEKVKLWTKEKSKN